MHFNSLEHILTQLEQQPGWEKFREYRQLLKCWHHTVNQNTARHTRPLHVTRQVFWIATSSAARAQELSFQRYTLLKRLNQQLPFTLKDIRFTTSGWEQQTSQLKNRPSLFNISSKYKSEAASSPTIPLTEASNAPLNPSSSIAAKNAVQRWINNLAQSNSSLINCPNCNALTSKGEIERWNLCYHCVAQKWSQEYRPPTFPELK